VSPVIVVFQGEGYGLRNPALPKFIAMAAIIAAAASDLRRKNILFYSRNDGSLKK